MIEITVFQFAIGIAAQFFTALFAVAKVSRAIERRFDSLDQKINDMKLIQATDTTVSKGRIDVLEARLNASESSLNRIEKTFIDMHSYLVQNSEFKPRR